ncbi:MMPL family transporter [Streptomyces sp. NBC_00102]|uniref:MMPL family transporter n=1 Tax=Streptomyces sp. NBC_00102 TaxID=2975652 RepID=UPI00224F2ABB|nr:MMPL family transporter [Streptomyces sp. NBC_00102]MCX5397643.1 MMPL family transporter [Streptomyces sp. NBC_00102]
MATFLHRIGRFAFGRRWLVVLLWAVVLGAVGAVAAGTTNTASSNFSLPGTESQRAFDLLAEKFPAANAEGASARVVVRAPQGERVDGGANRTAMEKVLAELKDSSSRVAQVSDPFAARTVSEDGVTAYAQITYTVGAADLTDADHTGIDKALDTGRDQGLTVEASGDALAQPEQGMAAEAIGFLLAALVLVITFGSLVAAGFPLLTALTGVGVSTSLITAVSATFELDSSTSALASMLGIAVGIDYALFIVSRYRAERADGYDAKEAAARANGTAGSAVVFAGVTVIIALAGLAVVNLPLLTAMGLAAAGAVVIAVLVAITLVPALLSFGSERVLGRARKRGGAAAPAKTVNGAPKVTVGRRWITLVMRRPAAVLILAVVALGTLALPAADLKLGLPDDGSAAPSSTQRKAYDLLSESFGPGFNGPLIVTVDDKTPATASAAATSLGKDIKALPDVKSVSPAAFNKAGDTGIINVVPGSGPTTDATKDLVADIRALAATSQDANGARAMVTGTTALNIDVSDKFSAAIVPYLVLVVGLAFLVLILVFRSILVPVKAALGFLLSVLASLGSLVAVFQWGWLKDLFGLEQPGPIMSLMPILLVGIVFGLAMDYQVFLVTRMREAYVHGADPRTAIETGFRHSAKVVTAAALIMISVFAGFIGAQEAIIKALGFALAVAVALDAFVVRMTIVPAVLTLLGKHAWSLPRWIDRILPEVDIEGEKLARRDPEAAAEPFPDAEPQLSGRR